DESRFARQVAERFGTEHTEACFSTAELLALIPEVFAYLDEPFADPSVLPTYLLCRHTRAGVTVALGGDGGDELFMGYPTFDAVLHAARFARLPGWGRRANGRRCGRVSPPPLLSLRRRPRQSRPGQHGELARSPRPAAGSGHRRLRSAHPLRLEARRRREARLEARPGAGAAAGDPA